MTTIMYKPSYLSKKGYASVEGELRPDGRFKPTGSYWGLSVGREIFTEISDALKVAEQQRLDRIKSLEGSLTKVRKLGPHYP